MLGIMQGRLSPPINQKIQAFPEKFWKAEFLIAEAIGFDCIEWTLDFHNIYQNPLIKFPEIIKDIQKLSKINIKSLTYDVAMQKPLVVNGMVNPKQITLLELVLSQMKKLQIEILVLPLVDNSSVINERSNDEYINILKNMSNEYLNPNLRIAIESDYHPAKFKEFIDKINSPFVGVNYDTGNSAACGFNFEEEMHLLSSKIFNIHIKDRHFQGSTVSLGYGSAPLEKQLRYFKNQLPDINLILQTARSKNGNDIGDAKKYLKFLKTGKIL